MPLELVPKDFGKKPECKIIILGKTNLMNLAGYKAEATKTLSVLPDKFHRKNAYITIRITGFSNKGATELYDSLVALSEKEITEEKAEVEKT